jgi:DNA helicase-2/ATP-dependent DNA helicase PcrA
VPDVLSASQLVRLRADAAGLARDLARPLPRPPAPHAKRGTEFHAWVESLFDARPLIDPTDLPGAGDADVDDEPDLAVLKEAFLASPYAARRPVVVEAPFELVLAGRVVRGRIDAVYPTEAGGYEVVDWKTGRGPADPTQLAVYRLAWAELAGVPVERVDAAFLHVRTGEVVRPAHLPGRPELEALLAGEAGGGDLADHRAGHRADHPEDGRAGGQVD